MRRLAMTVLVAVLTLLFSVGSAAHAADELALSTDGRHWSPTLTEPLFDPASVWVPGDSRTAAFHVRNQGPSAGTLRVELRSEDPDRLLADDSVRLQARLAGDTWVELEEGGPARRVAKSLIPPRAQDRLEVRATFDPRSGNQTQADRAGLTVVVRLSGDTPPASNADTDAPDGPLGALPRTGADAIGSLLIIGAVAIGCGIALRRAGRQT